jgi:hypothetical protein
MIRWSVAAIVFCIAATPVLAADPTEIGIGYLGRAGVKAKLSLVELPAENDGIAGARLAVEDNNTTGKFLNQRSKRMTTSRRQQPRLPHATISSSPIFQQTSC